MSDELSDLRLFTKMVSAGSLSETARRLNSSLTAMSRRLAQMEERLGVRLIDSGSRRFSLKPVTQRGRSSATGAIDNSPRASSLHWWCAPLARTE
jgi:DNA-binding transcriptional LysR family regulator